MGELEAIDAGPHARAGQDEPRLGERVHSGPVQPRDDGAAPGARVAILGFADERAVLQGGGRAGPARGPAALRRWLYALGTGGGGELEPLHLFDLGDAAATREDCHALLEESVQGALGAGARVIVLGGGQDAALASHSGLLRALPGGARLAALRLSPRCGVRPFSPAAPIASEETFRRLQARWPGRYSMVTFGAQLEHVARADLEWAHAQGWPVLELRRLREDGLERRFQRQLTRARADSGALAFSVDLSAVQAAFAPGVCAPTPDGLSPGELLALCRGAGREPAVRVFDLTGCAPDHDVGDRTAQLGAAALWAFLAGACESR